jgi:transposase InsO family protein
VTDALTMAIERRRPVKGRTVVHSDRGSQYTSQEFRDLAMANGIIPSVGNTGTCFDNALAESFNATIKKKLIHLHTWPGLSKVKSAVFEYIEVYYNRKRPHTQIGNLYLHEFELTFPAQLDEGMGEAA